MSQLYWNTPLLSPFLSMDHKQIKRSRSNDSIDRSFKRSKPLQIDSPISVSSEPVLNTTIASTLTTIYPSISPVPTHAYQQQQEHQQEHQTLSSIKSFSISTKTLNNPTEEESLSSNTILTRDYLNINGILYNAHVERYGDPETRESWWQEEQDIEMQDDLDNSTNSEYDSMNSVLRQAFLQRHQQHRY